MYILTVPFPKLCDLSKVSKIIQKPGTVGEVKLQHIMKPVKWQALLMKNWPYEPPESAPGHYTSPEFIELQDEEEEEEK